MSLEQGKVLVKLGEGGQEITLRLQLARGSVRNLLLSPGAAEVDGGRGVGDQPGKAPLGELGVVV